MRKKQTVKVTFKPASAPKKGDVLYVNEEFKTQAEGIKIGKNRLREANKELVKATLKYVGLVNRYAGDTITLSDYGKFSGKYLIVTVDGNLGTGGTETTLQIRKVLAGY